MNKIMDTLGTPDNDGVRHVNVNTPACPHCGHVDVKFSQDGMVALYHPGAECCEPRILQQIAWRRNEIANLNAETQRAKETVATRSQEREWKGDYHQAMNTLEGKLADQIAPINEELQHLGRQLTKVRGAQ